MIYTKEQSRCGSIPSGLWAWQVAMFLKVNSALSIQPSFCGLIQVPLIQQIQRKSCFNPRKDFIYDSRTKMCHLQVPTNFSKLNLTNFVCLDFHKACSFISIRQKGVIFRSLQIKELSLLLFQSCVNWMIFFVYHLAEMMLMTLLILNLAREQWALSLEQIMKEAFQGGMLSLWRLSVPKASCSLVV